MAKLGIMNNGVFIGAMQLPDRKRPSLVIERGNQCIVIGSFNNNTTAIEEFEKGLTEFIARGEEE